MMDFKQQSYFKKKELVGSIYTWQMYTMRTTRELIGCRETIMICWIIATKFHTWINQDIENELTDWT